MWLGLLLPLLPVVAGSFGACGFPGPEACELACGADGACPGGFECQAATQLCVPRGQLASCSVRDNPPDGPSDTDAGTAGQGGAGGTGNEPDAGTAGSNTAGASGSGGVPNEPPDPDTLVIVGAGTIDDGCTGDELLHDLQAAGGVGPYTWRLLEAPSGVSLSGDSGEAQRLFGIPEAPGRVLVELEDGVGNTAVAEVLVVYETPEVASLSLPAYCAGATYAAELHAGGGASDGVWSAELLPEPGQPDSLGELGLAIDGSVLSGELAPADQELGPYRVVLGVFDGHCASAEVEVELDVEPVQSPLCPSIQVLGSAFDELSPACVDDAYAGALEVDGGEPPYTWTELATPPGLYFDPDTASIGGVPSADGVLDVALTDGLGRTVRKSYALEARQSCWLAYVASEPFPARLELVDGRRLAREPEAARWSLPSQATTDPVLDFAFSPDGRSIVYRLGAGAPRLELARVSDGVSRALEVAGSVAAYAWSPDSARLAVVFGSGGDTFIAGFVPATSEVLPVRGVPSVDSPLIWSSSERLAFLSSDANLPGRRRLVTLRRNAFGFDAPVVRSELDFSAAARLRAGPDGVIVVEPENGSHYFYADGAAAPVAHAEDVSIGAGAVWAGAARSGALQLYRPSDASGPAEPAFITAPGCTTLVGWASARDRIACVDTRGGQNAVVWFDVLTAPSPRLVELPLLAAAYEYPAGVHAGRRRAFSGRGRWFAFASDEETFVARLDGARPELALTLPSSALGIRPGLVSFSPDERLLVLGAGNTLGLAALDPAVALRVLSASASFDEFCSERAADAGSGWCGGESGLPDLAWSPGSDVLMFRSSLGTLQLLDVSRARTGSVPAALSPDVGCSEACSSAQSARFQP